MLRSVLLPQPLGPISATTSPSATVRLTPSTAVSPPPAASANRMLTLRYSRRVAGAIGVDFCRGGSAGALCGIRLPSILASFGPPIGGDGAHGAGRSTHEEDFR